MKDLLYKDTTYQIRGAGFTLIEVLIYLAIIGLVIATFVTFSISITNSRNEAYVVQEVQANSRTALDIISQKLKAAEGVNIASSTFGSDPGLLSLSMTTSSLNPTIIDLNQDDGVLRIQQGTSTPVTITSDEVKVTNLVFTNLTGSSTRENIRAEITVEFNTSTNNVEYEYLQSLQTAVSLRY